ncbi:hypothetical protein F5Y19DRAFT_339362 [Xylariaceae sp. FL1651]|nr:hypothetical protein F5Y19DRAFT_339362 [Xylariaceae sp. FL1651]
MDVQLGPSSAGTTMNPLSQAADARYGHHNLHHPSLHQNGYYASTPTRKMRKRKAESQENERLSKRLSLLNLERNGQKLYVPVESPKLQPPPEDVGTTIPSSSGWSSTAAVNEDMQLDDTKHKVYIYDLDAELSSADENSESESSLPGSPNSSRGRLVFLPDIEKHLSLTRIPPFVLANNDGELGGYNIKDMQMVLYSDTQPSSLTVPPEQDSVRKAILEARARARQKQEGQYERERKEAEQRMPVATPPVVDLAMNGFVDQSHTPNATENATPWREALAVEDDVDAMDMD